MPVRAWILVVLGACAPIEGGDAGFGVGPQDGCDQVYPLIDAYVLSEDRAPADWEPTTMNPDCGRLPPDFPEGCDEIGPRESWNAPRTHCFVHVDYDCEGGGWYTIAAGTDGLVVGKDACGWQVFFDPS